MQTPSIVATGLFLTTLCYSTAAFSGCDSDSLPTKKPGRSIPLVLCDGDFTVKEAATAAAKSAVIAGAEAIAVPVAIKTASIAGVAASTGTPIAALSGAAATSATLAAVGGSASIALGAVGIVAAPAVVGGAIVLGVGTAVGYGINWLLFD
ncbi:MAG: hypothetical protein QG599_923 [Pseudomonadota bacterium]|nr:hypothetical protein [Pseudomonadota bacterium]